MASDAQIKAFREKLLDDSAFRKSFAKDPAAALRTQGIDVPAGVKLPALDAKEFESRIANLKTALGPTRDAISGNKSVDDIRLATASSAKINALGNFAVVDKTKIGRSGTVFTISAFGTLDW